MLSTLKTIFTGKKELFEGLAIHAKDYKWETYPVIHLDLANCDSRTPEELQAYLEHLLKTSADGFHRVPVAASAAAGGDPAIRALPKPLGIAPVDIAAGFGNQGVSSLGDMAVDITDVQRVVVGVGPVTALVHVDYRFL